MATESYKVGPGSLELGSGPLAVSGQFSDVSIQWSESVKTTDDIDLLDGTTLDGDENPSYSATITGSLVQDLSTAGVIAWSWTNKGTEQAFEFVPNTTEDRMVSGTLVPVPIQVGGPAKQTAVAQITWRIVGDPVFGDATP
jgi:hypothetical protein